jgi:hypothetical protein
MNFPGSAGEKFMAFLFGVRLKDRPAVPLLATLAQQG